MQMNYEKDGKYEKLYPKTISSNVEMLDGRDLNKWKQDFEDEFNVISDNLNEIYDKSMSELWRGKDVGDASMLVKPAKPLNLCRTGWILVFVREASDNTLDNISYHHIPKIHPRAHSGASSAVKMVMGSISGTIISKYMYISNLEVKGHSSNTGEGASNVFLYAIYEY